MFRSRKRRYLRRRGAAVVEAAITLPIIFTIILGTTEVCNRVFLKQSLAIIAYEGARVAIIPGSTFDDVEMQIEEVAEARGVGAVSVTVDPSDFDTAPEGTILQISVSSTGNQPLETSFFASASSEATVAMMKEKE